MSTVRRWRSSLLLLLASLMLASCASLPSPAETVTVSVLSFNDFHGNLLPPNKVVRVEDKQTGQFVKVPAGGVAYMRTLVKKLAAENPGQTLLVAAGDLIGASPQESGLFHDEPTIEAMNQLGVSLSSVGNHEFDRGKAEILRIQYGGCYPQSRDGRLGVVGVDTCMNHGQFSGAAFQYLSANVINAQTGKTLFPPYAIREMGGVKVAFIGVTLKDTPAAVIPSGVVGLRFMEEAETVNRLVPELQRQGAAIIIVLLHQGAETSARTINDKTCPGFDGEALKIVARMDDAVKVVITGHTHDEFVCRFDGKLLTQAGHYGRMLTKIDLTVHARTHDLLDMQARNHVVVNDEWAKTPDGQKVPLPQGMTKLKKDPEMDRLVQRYARLTARHAQVTVARIGGYLDRTRNAAGESALGNVVADAFLAATSHPTYAGGGAQIAFMNPGGIRSNLNQRRTITAGDMYRVLPFTNNLVTMTLTGAQIKRLLEQQWECPQPAGGRVLSVSKGFTYAWDARQPEGAPPGEGNRVIADSMKLHGVPILPLQTYRVTANDFLAAGGDHFTVFEAGSQTQDGMSDREALTLYLRAQQPLSVPAIGRITRLN